VVEVGRTFGGRPLHAAEHAELLLARAAASGIPRQVPPAEVEAAVAESTDPAGELLEPDDDIVFALSLEGVPAAAYIDSLDGPPAPELGVSCRLLSQPARALARYGAPHALRAATDGREGAWPLWPRPDGTLADMLGGVLAPVTGGRIAVPAAAGAEVAVRRLAELAPTAGFEVVEGEATREAAERADELLIVGMPFCILAAGELDGRALGSAGAREKLLAAWSDFAGVDLLQQVSALAEAG
jgi:hypothetical protein